ncbi:MAG TPA: lytic murein transglycosylase, partial [Baekduia sp.]|nr:lytic murein transglycosylase [Baekduia sp.]
MATRRAAGTLATAGVFLAAFGSGSLPVGAQQEPQPAAPSDEAGRQAPAPAPAPAPPATEPPPAAQPGPAATSGDPRPSAPAAEPGRLAPGSTTPTSPAPPKAADRPADDRRATKRAARKERTAGDGEASRTSTTAGEKCVSTFFLRRMTAADRKAYLASHAGCATGSTRDAAPTRRTPGGAPTPSNPSYSEALPGPAPIGVPNFFIEKFRIPPFLLPIYQAAGIEHGIRWEVLAAINEIETDYGRNLNVSSAGALGWMQFMPATWKAYGVDANRDGAKDPYNPVDAIFAAARYLKAAGAEQDLRRAIFAYNHADWYVESVLLRARLIGGLPADLVGSLSGLTQGRFPVHAKATYADDLSEADTERKIAKGRNAAIPVEARAGRRGIDIFAKAGSPVVATHDAKIVGMGRSERLGKFLRLRDVHGNTYTYAGLGEVVRSFPVPKDLGKEKATEGKAKADPKPTRAASAPDVAPQRAIRRAAAKDVARAQDVAITPDEIGAEHDRAGKEGLFAHPARPRAYEAGGRHQLAPDAELQALDARRLGLDRKDVVFKPLRKGARVVAGTVLARIAKPTRTKASHLRFEIRPAGRGAPRIDPKPILDGWKLLESTAVYRAVGRNPLAGENGPSIGQVLLMSKEQLQRRVLRNPRIEVYECGARDIKAGVIDRRVLASLEFLASNGLRPTVTSLRCGHGYLTASGNVSHHSSGNAVDIAAVNGVPILGHQGEGSITDLTIRRLLTLQGTLKPAQIISLMTYEGADNTMALPDHHDHIHVGWQPQGAA